MSEKYELVVIFSAALAESQAKSAFDNLKGEVESQGGKLTFEDFWGKRRFAYRIAKMESGFYFSLEFEFPRENVRALESSILLKGDILRHLLVKVPSDFQQKTFAEIEQASRKLKPKKDAKRSGKSAPARGRKIEKVEPAKEKEKEVAVDKSKLDKKLEEILSEDL